MIDKSGEKTIRDAFSSKDFEIYSNIMKQMIIRNKD